MDIRRVVGLGVRVQSDPEGEGRKGLKARVAGVPAAERKNMTFVFVTPRNWPGKDKWAKEKVEKSLEGCRSLRRQRYRTVARTVRSGAKLDFRAV